MRNGCTVVAFIAGMLQALAVAGQTDSNYVDLQAQVINLEGAVQLSYTCHAQEFGYQNVPVDVYIGAKLNSPIADAAASVDQLLAGGGVRIFYPGMRGTYQYTTALAAPTFSRVAFSDVVMSGSVVIDSVAASIYDGSYTMFIVFMYSGNGGFVRGDGMPVELSNVFTPFLHHVALFGGTIHAGDGYDPYMAPWEVSHPEGIRVERSYTIDAMPGTDVIIKGMYWGTYYQNPVYINGVFLGYLPSMMNGNYWATVRGKLSRSLFRQGANNVVFKCDVDAASGHYDNYMIKGWGLFYN